MILKEQNCRIVNQFEEGKFFHTEMLVKPLSISHLIFLSWLNANNVRHCIVIEDDIHNRLLYMGLNASIDASVASSELRASG